MRFKRAAGILLHPTSLPGPYGIGDLGREAFRFVDFLQQSHQTLWQVLPLTPTGYGDSPYASFSAFAGNPLLISPDILREQNLLEDADLANRPEFRSDRVEYGPLIEWKMTLLNRSYQLFKNSPNPQIQQDLTHFASDNAAWLEDYALFMAAKQAHDGVVWSEWEPELALRNPASLLEWREKLVDQINFQKYLQFIFFQQWFALKKYANDRQIKIIGDIPIFVAYDSADVWAHPDLFYLDASGHPTHVAGVPPDYFSATGQYWGNPLYRWDVMMHHKYEWWIERFRQAFRLTDYLRLDHFRGFAAYWEVPVNAEQTAANGRWVTGPGAALFQTVQAALGEQPIIAEDLGIITPDVVKIREVMNLPGMRVLQFAFGAFDTDWTDAYLPHNFENNTVVYTGTHDNDTTAGWFSTATDQERSHVLTYFELDPANPPSPAEMAWRMVRQAFASVADLAVVPLQDVLGVGNEGRMNYPGRAENNWAWRYQPDSLSDRLGERLAHITEMYARWVPERAEPLKGQGII